MLLPTPRSCFTKIEMSACPETMMKEEERKEMKEGGRKRRGREGRREEGKVVERRGEEGGKGEGEGPAFSALLMFQF